MKEVRARDWVNWELDRFLGSVTVLQDKGVGPEQPVQVVDKGVGGKVVVTVDKGVGGETVMLDKGVAEQSVYIIDKRLGGKVGGDMRVGTATEMVVEEGGGKLERGGNSVGRESSGSSRPIGRKISTLVEYHNRVMAGRLRGGMGRVQLEGGRGQGVLAHGRGGLRGRRLTDEFESARGRSSVSQMGWRKVKTQAMVSWGRG